MHGWRVAESARAYPLVRRPPSHGPAGLGRQLEGATLEGPGVVPRHESLLLVAEDLLEVGVAKRDECGRGIGGRAAERGVAVREEAGAQIGIGRRPCRDVCDAELVDQPILEGPIEPLAAPARLRRLGRNVLDAEPLQRPPDLRELVPTDGTVGLRRVERPVRAVRIDGHR